MFIEPIRLLENGDAWIYNYGYVIYDKSADFPDEYKGKNIAEIFEIQKAYGATHYESLVDGVLNATEGTGWYIWLPDKGREFAAWTSVRVGNDTWTVGLSTPEPEIVAFSSYTGDFWRELSGAIGISALLTIVLLLLWRQRRKDQDRMSLLEQAVAVRTTQLADSEARYRGLIESQNDLIIRRTPQGDLTFANDAYCRKFGKRREVLVNTNFEPEVEPNDPHDEDEMLQDGGSSPDRAFYEHNTMTAEGWRWLAWESYAIRDEKGDTVEIQSVGRDITEHKRLQAQFLQAQRMETVGRLASGIAHDFNNLLAVIAGYTGVLKKKLPEDESLQKPITQIIKTVDRAGNLTRQLLTFSHRRVSPYQIVDLNQLILDADNMLRRLIGEHIELVTIPGAGVGLVRADPGQLEQVLVNLVVNARDAMPQGGTLVIETSNVTIERNHRDYHKTIGGGDFVLLMVRDTGLGMDEETQVHLFEPFFTTKEPDKGTGLGLTTVYNIVTQHGGYMRFDSVENQGTQFRIYLPRTTGEPQELAHHEHREVLPEGQETILVIEDEPTLRALIVDILSNLGYIILEAATCSDALRISQDFEERIDLLLSDVVMPQMSGEELAKQLRAVRTELPVLFISGYVDGLDTQPDSLDHHTEFLQKPFTGEVLAHKVREMLDRHK